MTLPAPQRSDILRFSAKVIHVPPPRGSGLILPCWIWTGAKSRGAGNKDWYGSFWFSGKVIRAHRFSAFAFLGRLVARGNQWDHLCERSLCTCPWHLEEVSGSINSHRRWYGRGLDLHPDP